MIRKQTHSHVREERANGEREGQGSDEIRRRNGETQSHEKA